MSTHSVESKRAIELQHAASDAYRLARDTRDADPALARAPTVAGLQRGCVRLCRRGACTRGGHRHLNRTLACRIDCGAATDPPTERGIA